MRLNVRQCHVHEVSWEKKRFLTDVYIQHRCLCVCVCVWERERERAFIESQNKRREKAEEVTLMTTWVSPRLDRVTPDLSFVNKPSWTLVLLGLGQQNTHTHTHTHTRTHKTQRICKNQIWDQTRTALHANTQKPTYAHKYTHMRECE